MLVSIIVFELACNKRTGFIGAFEAPLVAQRKLAVIGNFIRLDLNAILRKVGQAGYAGRRRAALRRH